MTDPIDLAAGPPQAKVDPQQLELRSRPRPAVRFRKGLVIGISGGGAALIAIIGWFALSPPAIRIAPQDAFGSVRGEPADMLQDVPKSYAEVPMLGPPLPGDLGRPILKRRVAAESRPTNSETDRLKLDEEERVTAIRSASVMVNLAKPAKAGPANPVFAKPLEAEELADGQPTLVLSAGTVIPASLVTGINSDVPGIVIAQVTDAVRDSATGRQILIPQGARLLGAYENKTDYGQRRAMLNWSRLVLPDGRSLALDNQPATDRAGYAGLEDQVDFHGWRLLKGIALSTLLGLGPELSLGDSDPALARALGGSALQSGSRAGDEITRRNLDIKPSITVRPGWPVRLILNQDLKLVAWREVEA